MRLCRILFLVSAAVFFLWSVSGGEERAPLPVRVGLLDVGAASGREPESIEFTALRRIFDVLGIPCRVLDEPSRLQEHRVVFAGGALTNREVNAELSNALYAYVEDGGVLFAAGEVGNKLFPLFGIGEHRPSRRRYRMSFIGEDASLRYIDHPRERTISLGNGEKRFHQQVIWSHGYTPGGDAVTLARFENGAAGYVKNRYGRGVTYLLGLSFTESVLRPQIGMDYEAQRRYVNSFEPSADVIMLLARAVYEAYVSPFVYLSTVPFARSTALVLSHDVDAQTSFLDSLKFAALEERFGVKSTFFQNTKYVVDWMDIDYYNIRENVEAIRELKRRGWDIGSHTVSHHKQFSSIPEGDPGVTFLTYDPRKRKTVQGEVRVSKELLDRDIPGQDTVSFRAGDLEFPHVLIRVLEEAGYRYDSTFSANDVLTAFPYFALQERHLGSRESKVVEIPVTLDDSLGYLAPGNIRQAVDAWLEVLRANRDNEAVTVLLIHPSDTRDESYKLEAQKSLMKAAVDMDAWMGDLTSFGEFWRLRHQTGFSVFHDEEKNLIIRIEASPPDAGSSLGFVVGNTDARNVVVEDRNGAVLPYQAVERGGKLYVGTRAAVR